jgi:hypothetical protein
VQDTTFAVRWYRRRTMGGVLPDWTRWHWTEDGLFTVCGWAIPLAIDGGSFVPETDSRMGRVDCQNCRRKLSLPIT